MNTAIKDEQPSLLQEYFSSHKRAFFRSITNLWHNPLNTFITILMISIALALPVSLLVFLENAKSLSGVFTDNTQISLYLKMNVDSQQVNNLVRRLQEQPDIAKVTYISPEKGLQEFQQQTGITDTLNVLKENPLPGVIILEPKRSTDTPNGMNTLLNNVKTLPEVDNAVLDMQWLKRLMAILDLGKHLVFALGCLLACGILFIIGNAIQLSLQKYHEEISVFQLIGASDSYIRRPFLYAGFWYGFFGAILALIFVDLLLLWISVPVNHLAILYQSNFHLAGIYWQTAANVIISGVVLGLLGAGLTVKNALKPTNF